MSDQLRFATNSRFTRFCCSLQYVEFFHKLPHMERSKVVSRSVWLTLTISLADSRSVIYCGVWTEIWTHLSGENEICVSMKATLNQRASWNLTKCVEGQSFVLQLICKKAQCVFNDRAIGVSSMSVSSMTELSAHLSCEM